MPNQTFRLSNISRRPGRSSLATAAYAAGEKLVSVVASAAYRSGESLTDQRAGKTFDYTRKEDILFTHIFAPAGVAAWVRNRQALWNAVEQSEKRKDARLARSIIAALPRELTLEQNIAFVTEFVQTYLVAAGMAADVAIHDKIASDGLNNPHVHLLLTTRAVGPDGFTPTKNRAWNTNSWLINLRHAWETLQNDHLDQAGSGARLDLRSYHHRALPQLPQVHLGPRQWQQDQDHKRSGRGEQPARGRYNDAVKTYNFIHTIMRAHPLVAENEAPALADVTTLLSQRDHARRYADHLLLACHVGRTDPLVFWEAHHHRQVLDTLARNLLADLESPTSQFPHTLDSWRHARFFRDSAEVSP